MIFQSGLLYQCRLCALLLAISIVPSGVTAGFAQAVDDVYRFDHIRLLTVVELSINDPSGLDLHSDPQFLWIVSDDPGENIYRMDTQGQVVSTVNYSGEDMEGITHDPATNTLWIVEERARNMVQVNMSGNVLQQVSLDIGQPNPNDGLEGITMNTLNRHFFVANQQNPRVIWELNESLEVIRTEFISFEAPFNVENISGLFHEPLRDELWMVSAASAKIVVLTTNLEPLRYYELDMDSPEGIAVDLANNRLYVVSDEDNTLYTYEITSVMNPEPFLLSEGDYDFEFWAADEPEFSYPHHMVFQMSGENDPGLSSIMVSPYTVPENDYHSDDAGTIGFPYNNTRRTRINGLGEDGISFINTARERDVGAAVVALDTRGVGKGSISWLGGTLRANNRAYAIRLQYRVGVDEPFADLLMNGQPVEYERSANAGHTTTLEHIPIPEDALDQPYVQLRWKFYYTGQQTGGNARDELRLDNIHIEMLQHSSVDDPEPGNIPAGFELHQNYPNPFNPTTTIHFTIREAAYVRVGIYDLAGQLVQELSRGRKQAGQHHIKFDGTGLSSGVYVYRVHINSYSVVDKMLLLK